MPPSQPNSPTVFVVDDDASVRTSLGEVLAVLKLEVRAFSAPGAFHRHYRAEMPGCLLLDIRMPRQNGIALYEQLLREGKRIPVIFITAHADVSTAVAAMKTGALELLEKPFDCATLVERVAQALALDAQRRRSEVQFTALAQRLAALTPAQRQTLELIRAGVANKAIARRLGLTERAVEMRRSTIMRKLQVRSVAELVELAVTHQVLADLRRVTDELQAT